MASPGKIYSHKFSMDKELKQNLNEIFKVFLMFLCIGKAHEMYKSYERVGLRDKWQAGVTRPVLG
ncbi:hypothetical protein SEEA0411_10586 [Salmonella enterica subsp. enterica serovar Agona str. 460004 1-1]|nr:hypothetical protein SEEE1445_08710 [Salmonella enterica subsp. enterica serovar Enteritidis str. CDC_2010K_1445]ESB23114.1 hypothetical protein SEEA0411_10586 [Salmonella enterica subsp. enterica serovar Agona str. 460004 1-1]